MTSTTLRSPWVALAIAILLQAPRVAQAEDQQPPGQPLGPPPGPPPGQPLGPPPGYPPGPGSPPPYQVPPPGYGPPIYAPPAYAPANGPEQITNFDENRPVPDGYTKVSRKRKGLIIGGSVLFGVTYGIAMFTAAIGDDLRRNGESTSDVSALWIPVAGPFLLTGQADSSTGKLWLIHWGLGQTAGAIMLVYGLTSPRTLLVRNDQLSILPMIGNGASGMTVAGRF